jgi:hypothetical protein
MSIFRLRSRLPLLLLVIAAIAPRALATSPSLLEAGYGQMYNLDFADAHQTFQTWQKLHPNDPMAPASDAAAYLFSEFNRLHVLEVALFADDHTFEDRARLSPDPAVKTAFDDALAKSDAIASRVLAQDPQDANAQFARILANGLRCDYAALIEKRNFAALSYMKNSRAMAEKLLSQYPTYYDAYLAIGVENYLLGTNAAPLRWLLRIGGGQTDKDQGLAKLRLTAEHGHYLAPYARLLLAVAAVRDKKSGEAKRLLQGLSDEFPHNPLYGRELARLEK